MFSGELVFGALPLDTARRVSQWRRSSPEMRRSGRESPAAMGRN
jgi:hypothetical protein